MTPEQEARRLFVNRMREQADYESREWNDQVVAMILRQGANEIVELGSYKDRHPEASEQSKAWQFVAAASANLDWAVQLCGDADWSRVLVKLQATIDAIGHTMAKRDL